MKRFITLSVALAAVLLLNGCLLFSVGGGSKSEYTKATTGQQLLDLKKAKDAGAITDAEYEAQKAKILHEK